MPPMNPFPQINQKAHIMMLDADLALVLNAPELVEKYAADNKVWRKDFDDAYIVMSELGFTSLDRHVKDLIVAFYNALKNFLMRILSSSRIYRFYRRNKARKSTQLSEENSKLASPKFARKLSNTSTKRMSFRNCKEEQRLTAIHNYKGTQDVCFS